MRGAAAVQAAICTKFKKQEGGVSAAKKEAFAKAKAFGARDGNRTRGNQLGKLAPYH